MVRTRTSHWKTPIKHKKSLLRKWTFHFLNEEHSLNFPADWDSNKLSKLWRYNLHYFDDLNADAANSRVDLHHELLSKWIDENPPATGSGWEPYPTSLRVVNWIKWHLAGTELSQECLDSLATQTRWLAKKLEFHILGNHLFANAKALVFAGLFFEGKEADEWLRVGLKILKREVSEQILLDGGHFELSPMYQAIILEDLFDLINITKTFLGQVAEEQLSEWQTTSENMLQWLHDMKHPDGEVAFFNDSVIGIAATFDQLKIYAKHLGSNASIKNESLVHLGDSGYIKVKKMDAVGFMDVAAVGPDYLPGHAHADTLSFELSLFGQRVFVNSGISQYGNDSTRQKQRSTISHNTVCIDGEDSSEVWAGFRVARRACPSAPVINIKSDGTDITCFHDGYKRLPGKNIHKRIWKFKDTQFCVIDEISGGFTKAVANFYIHPDINVSIDNENINIFNLTMATGQVAQIKVDGADNVNLISTVWHPEFGVNLDNKCISVSFSSLKISMCLTW